MLSTAIEVKSPCTPTSSGSGGSGIAEVADVLICSISNRSQWWVTGIAYDCKNIVFVLRDTHCADGMRELVHKLIGMGGWIDLPDLRRVDKCNEDLAIRANGDILDPLMNPTSIMSAIVDSDFTTNHGSNSQYRSRNGKPFEPDHLHSESSMEKRCYGKRRDRSRISRYGSKTFWDNLQTMTR